ncbi:hypothetical protein T439DRAFT_301192 [Meredithblackwellia eburnea MCA 4105]
MSNDKLSLDESAIGGGASTPQPRRLSISAYLQKELNGEDATLQLTWACFLTGFTSAVTFTACYIWCGFQTGGTIQLGLALARLFSGPKPRTFEFEQPDRQALVSLLSFLIGTALGRLGDRIGPKKRVWLFSATMAQALCLMAAALTAWKSGESSFANSRAGPSWITPLGLTALGFASASLGIQGIIGKRLNTQFATCVVLTTIWVELINDPKLFVAKHVKSRDHKAGAVLMLFIGGIIGRALVDTIGAAGTFGIAAGFRVLSAVWWVLS